jgi:hypothetical protein
MSHHKHPAVDNSTDQSAIGPQPAAMQDPNLGAGNVDLGGQTDAQEEAAIEELIEELERDSAGDDKGSDK